QGYFDVRHDDAHAFTVHARGATIRDVGTVFTVHTRDGGKGVPAVRVAVSAGAVLMYRTAEQRGVVLHPGDVGVLTNGSEQVELRRAAAPGDDAAWTQGRLVFRDAPISDVADAIRRWYGIELRVDDASLPRTLRLELMATDPPDRVLRVIALSLGADTERLGDTAVLRRSPVA